MALYKLYCLLTYDRRNCRRDGCSDDRLVMVAAIVGDRRRDDRPVHTRHNVRLLMLTDSLPRLTG